MVVLFVDLNPHVPHFAKLPRYYFLAVLQYFVFDWIHHFLFQCSLDFGQFLYLSSLIVYYHHLFDYSLFHFETDCYLMLIDLTHCHILVLFANNYLRCLKVLYILFWNIRSSSFKLRHTFLVYVCIVKISS